MLAIDTNIIVRYLTGDHPEQSQKARALVEGADVFVATTVLLETELVLRAAYNYPPAHLATALRGFAGLPGVTIEDHGVVARALDWAAAGMDFADALHLAKAAGLDAFVSFDRRLARVANRLGVAEVRLP